MVKLISLPEKEKNAHKKSFLTVVLKGETKGEYDPSQGILGKVWRYFWLSWTSIWWAEVRDAARHPTRHRTDPWNYPAPNIGSSEVEKTCFNKMSDGSLFPCIASVLRIPDQMLWFKLFLSCTSHWLMSSVTVSWLAWLSVMYPDLVITQSLQICIMYK